MRKKYLIVFLSVCLIIVAMSALIKYTVGKQTHGTKSSNQITNASILQDSIGQSIPVWVEKSRVGDTIQGGIIYVLLPPSSPSDTLWHGIICATSDQSSSATWSEAVSICKSLKLNGYSDWQLPSSDQLHLMAENLASRGRGGFGKKEQILKTYWSSTEYTIPRYAMAVTIQDTGIDHRIAKERKFHVRAIRFF